MDKSNPEFVMPPESLEEIKDIHIVKDATEFCWVCSGQGKNKSFDGYAPCLQCNGTGLGESIGTYYKRKGISLEKAFAKEGNQEEIPPERK